MLLTAALAGIVGFQPSAQSQPPLKLAVVMNSAVGETQLGIDDLRAIFLRKRLVWSGGQHIVPINQPNGSPVRVAFDKTVLGFTPDQMARFWIDTRIRSGMQAPRTVAGDALIANVVKILPGCISYVAADQVSSAVRVVARIDAGRVLPP
ncbi:MAG TPA: hypothetical protein VJV78_14120 [Polyangiales bacterium]|nr:hypothetical protein [Polyangiales bacterium]